MVIHIRISKETSPMPAAILTRALRKVYPPQTVALDSLDLQVEEGELFGLLGPNGAGKTTAIGILTTRVVPTGGEAFVGGANVVSDSVSVRRRIGVVPQKANPDRSLTVLENLVYHASYFGVPRAEAVRRAEALLERMGIAEKRAMRVDTLSGGQQQRLMIARALSHDPRVIFLDEPTVGLDPQARLALWDILRELHAQGTTIIMTTHYMEEADQLCDRLAILDRGKLLALDTPSRLKQEAPGDSVVELTFDGDAASLVESATKVAGVSRVEAQGSVLRIFTLHAGEVLAPIIALGEGAGRAVRDIHLSRPSLETLFIHLTGRKLA
jgi:ABC-2 type transport system ATP-binding protein